MINCCLLCSGKAPEPGVASGRNSGCAGAPSTSGCFAPETLVNLMPAVRLTAPHRRSPSTTRNFVAVEGFPFWLKDREFPSHANHGGMCHTPLWRQLGARGSD